MAEQKAEVVEFNGLKYENENMLTPQQFETLKEFTEKSKHLTQDPADLIRFLRARDFDIAAATAQLEKATEWRKTCDMNVDTILDQEGPKAEIVKMIVPHNFHKFDKQGRPIYIERTGCVDVPRLLNLVTEKEMLHNHLIGQEYQLRRMKESTAERKSLVTGVCSVLDLTNMSLKHKKGMDFLKGITELDKDMYPENLGVAYVINTPWLFQMFWKVVRTWLDPKTREKFHVLGSDYQKVLVEGIGSENLPEEYGGTCRCNEDGSPCVPQPDMSNISVEHYDPPLIDADIAKGSKFEQELPVGEHGGTASWFFRTIKNDIKFGAKFIPSVDGEKEIEVVAPIKVKAYEARVEGSFNVEMAGKFIFTWDNGYSYFTSKKLRYNLSLDDDDAPQDAEAAQAALDEAKDEA